MPVFQYEPYDPTRTSGSIAELMLAGPHAQAGAARAIGEANARAAMQSGNAWANAIHDVGQIGAGAVNQWVQYKQDAPRREAEALALEEAKRRRDEIAAQKQQEQVITGRLKSLFSRTDDQGKPTLPTMQELVDATGDPERGLKIAQGLDAYQQLATRHVTDARKTGGDIVRGMRNLPQQIAEQFWPAVRTAAIAGGLGDERTIPPIYNPGFVAAMDKILNGPPKLTEHDPTKALRDEAGNIVVPAQAKPPEPVFRQDRETGKLVPVGSVPAGAHITQEPAPPRVNVNMGPEPTLPADPASQDILSQTGLSMNAFYHITGRTSLLARDAATRTQAAREAQAWARKTGTDVSTLPSQYKAYNAVLERNIERLNNTKIMEQELAGTIQNLQAVVTDKGLGQLNFANVVKIWAGGEVNDPLANQYAFHLEQLRNELAAYYAAAAGRPGSGITEKDNRDAERTIKNGIADGGLKGLAKGVHDSTAKMGPIMQGSVDRAQQAIWTLFGVGQNYKPKAGGRAAQGLREGTEGTVNGVLAVWKTVNGKTGWYAK